MELCVSIIILFPVDYPIVTHLEIELLLIFKEGIGKHQGNTIYKCLLSPLYELQLIAPANTLRMNYLQSDQV